MADLTELLEKARKYVASMSPAELTEMKRVQRKSWVRGEMLFEHPEMTIEQFEEIWQKLERT